MALVSQHLALNAPLRSFQHVGPQPDEDVVILSLLRAQLATAGFDIVAPLAVSW